MVVFVNEIFYTKRITRKAVGILYRHGNPNIMIVIKWLMNYNMD